MALRALFILQLCLPLTVMGSEVKGYVVDKFCWDKDGHRAVDGVTLGTSPELHTLGCMLMDVCKDSGYFLLEKLDTADSDGYMYKKRLTLDATSNRLIVSMSEKERTRGANSLGEVTFTGQISENNELIAKAACVTPDGTPLCVGEGATEWPNQAASGDGTLEAVYAFWDDSTNKQHTFHFTPGWDHGGTLEKQGDISFYAFKTQQANTEAVYDWWDDANKQHTFHLAPKWNDEKKGTVNDGVQFYAHKEHAPNTHPIYAFWDNVNKQHTFHLVPEWKHGDTMETKGDLVFFAYDSATPHKRAELKSVFDFWDDKNKQHTFHMAPSWSHSNHEETQGRVQFLAYDAHEERAKPVYDFWDATNNQHTFHFAPAWSTGEEQRGVQFYALEHGDYKEGEQGAAIYTFWDTVNKQNTFHVRPAWPNEEEKGLAFYAFAPKDDTVQGVYAFWDDINKQHTFHFPPAWKHGDHVETQGGRVFSAYTGPHEGTEAVYDWWDDANKQHTFHFPPAWGDEKQGANVTFYAFKEAANPNLDPVYDFWDKVNNQHTFHFPPAWANEEQKAIQFYAYKDDDSVWVPPTPMPTPVPTEPPATAKLTFTTNADDLADNQAFLDKCTAALKAQGHSASCVGAKDSEDGGIEIEVSGSQEAVDSLDAVGGWDDIVLDEVTRLAPTGAKAPQVGIESENTTVSASVRPGQTLMYVGVSSVVLVAQAA